MPVQSPDLMHVYIIDYFFHSLFTVSFLKLSTAAVVCLDI